MGFPYRLKEMLRRDLEPTAEIPATHDDCYAWISITRYPEDWPGRAKHPSAQYLIVYGEIRKDIIARYVHDGADVFPNDCEIYERYYANDDDELYVLLKRWVDDLDDFVEGWKTNNPL